MRADHLPIGKIEYMTLDTEFKLINEQNNVWGLEYRTFIKLNSMNIESYTDRFLLREPLLFAFANDADVLLHNSKCNPSNCSFTQFEIRTERELLRYWI